jgi:Mg-chelatase subunit ChlI
MTPSRMAVVIMAVSLLPAVDAGAQGLGDAAKKEKQRRERAANPAKTYTQGDLKALPPVANEGSSSARTVSETASSAQTAPQPAEQPGDSEAQKRGQDEKAWRSQVAAARERVAVTRKTYETVGPMNWAPEGEYVDFEGMKAAAKGQYEAAQKALDDLLEEARRANIPPGWLR